MKTVSIALKKGSPVSIILNTSDSLLRKTGKWCLDFLVKRGFQVSTIQNPSKKMEQGPKWILEIREDCPIAKSLGINPGFLDSAQSDAYILNVLESENGCIVSIIGRNPAGVRSGIARLIMLARDMDQELVAPIGQETKSPFFSIRRLSVAPTGRIAQGNEWCIRAGMSAEYTHWADTLWTNWEDERIRQYAEQIRMMGFNSVELSELRGYRGVFSGEELNHIIEKVQVFMKAAHEHDLQVCQFIWGQSLFEEGDNLCWNCPEERIRMELEFRRLATTYGNLVDHLVVHVGDPGGCSRNGCDAYKTTQEIAEFIKSEYRKINPAITVTLSSWANEGFWKGYSETGFLDETYSSKEIGIALHRWYDSEKAELVLNSGRQLDIWGWYLSDFEMRLDMHLLMRRLDKYYSSLPDCASRQVRAVSTEICFQGWPQIMNAYVSAQKMWDPQRNLTEIENEFCGALFGEKNKEAMREVYQVCEKYVHPEDYYGFIPETDCLPIVFGTSEYNREVIHALDAGHKVSLDCHNLPKMTTTANPQALKDYLMSELSLISIFSTGETQIRSTWKSGMDAKTLRILVDETKKNAVPYQTNLNYRNLLDSFLKLAEEAEKV